MNALSGLSRAFPLENAAEAAGGREAWATRRRQLEAQAWRSTPWGPRHHHGGPVSTALMHGFAAAMRACGLYRRGRRNALSPARVELDIACPGLPFEFDGFRILHVTDPHFDLCADLPSAIAAAVAEMPADVCLLTGDYRAASSGPHVADALAGLEQTVARVRAPSGLWATLGNHDCAAMVPPMEDLGIGVLVNEAATLQRGKARLRLVGLDDVHSYHTPAADAALVDHAPAGDGVFTIALVHSPDMARPAAALGYGLYLCGHTHGGQVCLPGGRPVVTHLDSHRRYAAGRWRIGRLQGYTSAGAGASGVPLRYFCQGEVTRLTLRRVTPTAVP